MGVLIARHSYVGFVLGRLIVENSHLEFGKLVGPSFAALVVSGVRSRFHIL